MKKENIKRANEIDSKLSDLKKTLGCIEAQMDPIKTNGLSIKMRPDGYGEFSINHYISIDLEKALVLIAKSEVERIINELEKELETL